MSVHQDGRTLPWLALGREVRPGALVLAVNTGYSAAAARLGIPGSGSASNTC